MFGSAAVSLLHVARGSADVYSESSIMLWDVAAGIAIVQGAGGGYVMKQAGEEEWCYEVFASNPALLAGGAGED
jgi:myo-inositol-1(or 4)-monophosphatase